MINLGPELAQRCPPPFGQRDGNPSLPKTRECRLAPGKVVVDLTPLPLETAPCDPTSLLQTEEAGRLAFWPTLENYRNPPAWQLAIAALLFLAGGAAWEGWFVLAVALVCVVGLGASFSQHTRPHHGFTLTRRGGVVRWIGFSATSWRANEILAVQLIPGLWYDALSPFRAYQLNLVLADGTRASVSNTRHLPDVCADSAALAFFLDVPLLNDAVDFAHPWLLSEFHVPARDFGPGSVREFPEYFAGHLMFEADSLGDIQYFLAHCPYATDQELYGQHDYWAHPCEFERVQRGDCEDRTLWAWRQLVEMGYDARFMVGLWHVDGPRPEHHAWVYFFIQDEPYVLETVGRQLDEVLIPWNVAERTYEPQFSVDGTGRTARHQPGSATSPIRRRAISALEELVLPSKLQALLQR